MPACRADTISTSAERSRRAARRRHRSLAVLPLMLVADAHGADDPAPGFSRLFLVLSVAPLGLIGVVAALLVADKPLGFVALLGVLALTGMIARNSVILIDQIETEKAHGRDPWDAVIEATIHRFRPILLTAAAAILGMIPIAPTIFWGPMAYAIMGGLAVATLLTLSSCRRCMSPGSGSRDPVQTPVRICLASRPACLNHWPEESLGADIWPGALLACHHKFTNADVGKLLFCVPHRGR